MHSLEVPDRELDSPEFSREVSHDSDERYEAKRQREVDAVWQLEICRQALRDLRVGARAMRSPPFDPNSAFSRYAHTVEQVAFTALREAGL